MGGSGGGGRGYTDKELKILEEKVKQTLREKVQPEKRNVFISFASEDLNTVNCLRGQAKKEESDIEFNDWSLKKPFDSENAEYIRRGIRERIRQSSVTICYVSDETAKSKWVDWEIRESIKLGKGVVAMYSGDKPPSNLPAALKEFKITPIKWQAKAISNAIAKEAE